MGVPVGVPVGAPVGVPAGAPVAIPVGPPVEVPVAIPVELPAATLLAWGLGMFGGRARALGAGVAVVDGVVLAKRLRGRVDNPVAQAAALHGRGHAHAGTCRQLPPSPAPPPPLACRASRARPSRAPPRSKHGALPGR